MQQAVPQPSSDAPGPPPPGDRRIRRLRTLLVNQIAAGEVVERPASVVKELLENALDAGATRVRIEIESGGIELVRVTDDGVGMGKDDLPLAVAPHATSKIETATDLDRIATFGFRGEALASIASVSRMSIRSRTASEPGGWQLDIEGDVVGAVRPASGAVGTSVAARNLFFNTPARRKFLRTVGTERTRCIDVVRACAMSHAAVAFEALVDGKSVLDVPPGQSPRDRALAILGKELESEMIEVRADRYDDARGLSLWGLVGKPSTARATARAQHLFINGRAIKDRTVQHAVGEAFRGLIEPGRYPTAVVMLELSPEGVDVNVHPQKTEVRFRDQSMVHSVVLRAVREALAREDLTPSLGGRLDGSGRGQRPGSATEILPGGVGGGVAGGADVGTRGFVDFFKRAIPERAQHRLSYDAVREAIERVERAGTEPAEQGAAQTGTPRAEVPDAGRGFESSAEAQRADAGAAALPAPVPAHRVLQVHNSYLVTQDEHGVVIVDQHALHERVMFEILYARVSEGVLESQQLLTPAVVEATPERIERLGELAALLAKIGIVAEPMGPRTVGVRSFATLLFERGVDPVEFMQELLDKADRERFVPDSEEALREVLDMMACKAAVKAGDRMSDDELRALLELRGEVERSSNCPHGRPTSVRLTISELERLFGRS
ncbi:MAG: DNA mismatch repair endonuclease MutL [Planctomycetota bacterium]|nr:DNA mismatch repair endonuclease MutL [Planctomycetota bacterium]